MAKKVGAGDGLRVQPFFGLEFLPTFFSMKKVGEERENAKVQLNLYQSPALPKYLLVHQYKKCP